MEEIAHDIYRELGVGHRENVYHKAFEVELRLRCIPYECERVIPVIYKEHVVSYMRLDLVVDGKSIIELKATKSLKDDDEFQLRRYLSATSIDDGYLINFGEKFEVRRIQVT